MKLITKFKSRLVSTSSGKNGVFLKVRFANFTDGGIQTKILTLLVLLLLLTPSGCTIPTTENELDKEESKIPPTIQLAPPTSIESPKDCTATLPQEIPPVDPYSTVVQPFDLVVSSGNRIYGLLRRPDPQQHPELCFPAVVLVPGGINPGRMEAHGRDAIALAEAGMIVVTFNPEGRADDSPEDIRSEGTEDFNGFRHQDSLCDLVKYVVQLPYVIPENIGIKSQSYGITMAAGCVGRSPELPVKYLVDGEGPPNSFVTCHEARALVEGPNSEKFQAVYDIFGRYSLHRDPSQENEAFWSEREAERFIGAFRGRYLRLQAEWDHAQPPSKSPEIHQYHLPPQWWQNKHTTDIVNIAIGGGVPWVRVNLAEQGNQVNATYDIDHPPAYLPGMLAERPWGVLAIVEMARME